MPCAGPSEEEYRAYMRRDGHYAYDPSKQELEAMLCGIVTVLAERRDLDFIVDRVNWHEVGVEERFFRKWWRDHVAKDEARQLEETERAELARLKAKYEGK